VHRMPQIGELGSGVWLASGFGGHGLNTTAMAGTLIARAIVEGDQTWRQFSPFELVWAGGIAGRVAIQMRSWIKRFRDRVAERRAHAREIAHRQARDAELLAQEAARAQEAAAQAEAAQYAVAEEAARYAEPEPVAEAEPRERPAAGRHRARRRRRRERSEGVS
jgi:gamma-glutamylputrescine oxidase